MDSGILNVFHDEPFENKYEVDIDFWSNTNESLGLQLTETLHGILPINPSDDADELFESSFLGNNYCSAANPDQTLIQNKNGLIYNDFASSIEMLGKKRTASENLSGPEPLTQFEFDSDSSQIISDHGGYIAKNYNYNSGSSSSIADYESHSSDYDEEYDDLLKQHSLSNVSESKDNLNELKSVTIIKADDYSLNVRSSLNNESECIEDDSLGLRIDANNFDLTDFITKDYQSTTIDTCTTNPSSLILCPDHEVQIISSKKNDSDSDSDIIVDVETVDNEENNIKLSPKNFFCENKSKKNVQNKDMSEPFVDNLVEDPSWKPKFNEISVKTSKSRLTPQGNKSIGASDGSKPSRHLSLVPNKKQCDFLKGKFSKSKNTRKNFKNSKRKHVIENAVLNSNSSANKNNKIEMKSKPQINISADIKPKAENLQVPNIGKDISFIKHDRHSIEDFDLQTNPQMKIKEEEIEIVKEQVVSGKSGKRKLNLEEYKKRRENINGREIKQDTQIEISTSANLKYEHEPVNSLLNHHSETEKSVETNSNNQKLQTEVTSIVKSLKENATPKIIIDPITEAKNKVLRLQERKKARQIRMIDSTVYSKVERVTKLPPLIDIMKNASKNDKDKFRHLPIKAHPDYEEIVIVSAGCNTEISIPPLQLSNHELDHMSNNSCSLLKSSALLYKTFKKVKAEDAMKIAGSSLIASIQDTVVKKVTTSCCTTEKKMFESKEHGENKIIMHLKKNRIRSHTYSISTQTDILPEFLPLQLLERIQIRANNRKHMRRKYRKRDNSSMSDSDFSSSGDDNKSSSHLTCKKSFDGSPKYRRRKSNSISPSGSDFEQNICHGSRQRRSRKNSNSSSHRSFSRSRSRSSARSSSSTTKRYPQSQFERNISIPAVEERRIVYIGRIERETGKETLRRKFIKYGPIKQITIHYKESGVKYGFITFERAEDAFTVIDSSSYDKNINMYDISFGGRRVFCRATYADLDDAGVNPYQSCAFSTLPVPSKKEDSFETLLLKVKAKLRAPKSSTNQSKI